MKFKLGIIIGFCSGYYLGARAGRARYEQLNRFIGKVRRSEAVDIATDKAKAVVDLSVERAKDFVGEHTGGTVEGPWARSPAPRPTAATRHPLRRYSSSR